MPVTFKSGKPEPEEAGKLLVDALSLLQDAACDFALVGRDEPAMIELTVAALQVANAIFIKHVHMAPDNKNNDGLATAILYLQSEVDALRVEKEKGTA